MQLIGLVLATLLLTLAGCAQPAKTPPATTAQREVPAPAPPPVQEPPAPEPSPTDSGATAAPNLDAFTDEPSLRDVLFEPNRADIVRDGASAMMSNAKWLVARWLLDNRDYFVLLEGHTDAREARGDNGALAELRVTAAARFLTAMGVPESRLLTVNYGAERPVCKDRSDACAAKNRRVHFRVKRR
jgi:peptidoglycan-associated lipoprotein